MVSHITHEPLHHTLCDVKDRANIDAFVLPVEPPVKMAGARLDVLPSGLLQWLQQSSEGDQPSVKEVRRPVCEAALSKGLERPVLRQLLAEHALTTRAWGA